MLPYYVVNAFTNKAFSGNPAGVVVLNEPIKEDLMQKIAKENKLSETAFILKEKIYIRLDGSHQKKKWIYVGMRL